MNVNDGNDVQIIKTVYAHKFISDNIYVWNKRK